ncbi:hypothetical protein ABZS71_10225 [Streptomyces sp. NPDC005393]|uniref:hypothetical protein n=1 Tax=Streptomyces sp. NPDC005393 TaxID=3157041 RepID=UPI0033A7A954
MPEVTGASPVLRNSTVTFSHQRSPAAARSGSPTSSTAGPVGVVGVVGAEGGGGVEPEGVDPSVSSSSVLRPGAPEPLRPPPGTVLPVPSALLVPPVAVVPSVVRPPARAEAEGSRDAPPSRAVEGRRPAVPALPCSSLRSPSWSSGTRSTPSVGGTAFAVRPSSGPAAPAAT